MSSSPSQRLLLCLAFYLSEGIQTHRPSLHGKHQCCTPRLSLINAALSYHILEPLHSSEGLNNLCKSFCFVFRFCLVSFKIGFSLCSPYHPGILLKFGSSTNSGSQGTGREAWRTGTWSQYPTLMGLRKAVCAAVESEGVGSCDTQWFPPLHLFLVHNLLSHLRY